MCKEQWILFQRVFSSQYQIFIRPHPSDKTLYQCQANLPWTPPPQTKVILFNTCLNVCFSYATVVSSLMTRDCRYIACVLYYGDKAREGESSTHSSWSVRASCCSTPGSHGLQELGAQCLLITHMFCARPHLRMG